MNDKDRLDVLVGTAERLVYKSPACDGVEVAGGMAQMLLRQLKFPECAVLNDAIKAAIAGNVDDIRPRLVAELKRLLVAWRVGASRVLEVETIGVVPAKYAPLWWHTAGKSQTASGYGRRLTTAHMVLVNGRWRRVYCCCFSNSGTCYIDGQGGLHKGWLCVTG